MTLRDYLINAPWWVLSLFAGTLFGAVMWLTHPGAGPAPAVIAGVLFGAIMGPVIGRRRDRARSALGQVSTGQHLLARRALRRGPAPTDPDTREMAYRLGTHALDTLTPGRRTFTLVTYGSFLVLSSVIAVTTSPWYWLGATFWTAMIAFTLWSWSHLQRRVELLRADGHEDEG
jgi:Flp pilus assembly protein TadB